MGVLTPETSNATGVVVRRKALPYCLGVTVRTNLKPVLKPISKHFTPYFSTGNMVSFKKVWSWNEFKKFVVFSTIRLKDKVNFFYREFLEVLYFPSAFIVVIEIF